MFHDLATMRHDAHPQEKTLSDFIQGRLPQKQSLQIESHLENCVECCDKLAELDQNAALNDNIKSAFRLQLDHEGEVVGNLRKSLQARYKIVNEIDRGGMGIVLLGHDQHLDRPVALKILPEANDNVDSRRRFAKEAKIGARLNHPGIATVYEYNDLSENHPFMVMRLVKGDTLQERIGKGESQTELLSIFVKICECISYANSQSIIHRDLKPQNIMVGEFGEVQVMDWGLARLGSDPIHKPTQSSPADSGGWHSEHRIETIENAGAITLAENATQHGAVMGTPAYMAAEQAEGRVNDIDHLTDVFGLGSILCEILTSEPPYPSDDPRASLALAKANRLSPIEQRLDHAKVDPVLKDLTLRCLANDKHARPANAMAVANEISAWRETVTKRLRKSELAKASSEAKLREETKRRQIQVLLIASTLVFVLVASWIWSMYQKQANDFAKAEQQQQFEQLASSKTDLILFDRSMQAAYQGFPKNERDFEEAEMYLSRITPIAQSYPNSDLAERLDEAIHRLSSQQQQSDRDKALLQALNVLDGVKPSKLREQMAAAEGTPDASLPNNPGINRRSNANFRKPPRRAPSGGHTLGQIQQRSRSLSNAAAKAFKDYELDPATVSPGVASRHLETRPQLLQTLVARRLDLWLHYATLGNQTQLSQWVLDLLHNLDPDPVRKKIRQAVADRDRNVLAKVIDLPNLEQQPPELIWSVAGFLRQRAGTDSLDLMMLAQLHHMDSSVINRDIANRLERMGRSNEAILHSMLASVSKTESSTRAMGLVHIADTFMRRGEAKSAVILLKKALELNNSVMPQPKFLQAVSLTNAMHAERVLTDLIKQNILTIPDSWIELGDALKDQKKFEPAIAAYEKALEMGIQREGRRETAEKRLTYCQLMMVDQ